MEQKIDPFASLMSDLVSERETDPYISKCISWMVYHLAKLMCILDALDDFSQDYHQKSPNILRKENRRYRDEKEANAMLKLEKINAIDETRDIVLFSMGQLRSTLSALPIIRNQSILENILLDNMSHTYSRVCNDERSIEHEST